MAGLYLHIPFCEHKCIYCDFYSIEALQPIDEFVRFLKSEIGLSSPNAEAETFSTVYFGGGTPSLLKPDVIGGIITLLGSTFRLDRNIEITLEANPGTVDLDKLRQYRRAGINRVSFGIQSFLDDDLRFLTRIHTGDQAIRSVRMAQAAGFDNVSLDLIFALPSQTPERWEQNLRQAVELGPSHISAYSLIVERGTPLARMVAAKQVSPLPIESEAGMYEFTMKYLGEAGYEHYEVSNYARPGYRSRHNGNYWNHTNYLGFGPSAHSFWGNRRWWNVANLRSYRSAISKNRLPVAGEEALTARELFDESVMLGLRGEGVDLDGLRSPYGVDLISRKAALIERLQSDELAVIDRRLLRLTDKGYLFCDEISRLLLSGIEPTDTSLRLWADSSILNENYAV
ncbi:MAG TPA: radical SAM family heme chaperone HemW [Bacteroidota bacterium]|nr:radical SAM family heme chaperone HemW [Bacteroidota bacterium]